MVDRENQIIINKFNQFKSTGRVPEKKGIGVSIDVETTGLNAGKDKVIEIGIVQFLFDRKNGEIVEVLDRYSAFEDPKRPLDDIIKKITGISDSDLEGNSFDDNEVCRLISEADFVIAHNAGFDRKFIEDRFDIQEDKPWVCSLNDYKWIDDGISNPNLELISYKLGRVEYGSHRALIDAEVVLHNFNLISPSGKRYLTEMARNAFLETHIIYAVGAPYAIKDELKDRGYRWNPGDNGDVKAWFIQTKDKESFENELEYLREHGIYGALISNVNATNRYSSRESESTYAMPDKPFEEKESIELGVR